MGKAARWLKGVLQGLKGWRGGHGARKDKRRWSFVSSPPNANPASSDLVAASSSQAAAPHRAALLIQSHFRGYLARRALKALKGLVKLQAVVRGHIMRKKTAETMRCIQAMLRAQARARSVRSYDSPTSSGKSVTQQGSGSRRGRVPPVDHPFKGGYVSKARSGPQLSDSMRGCQYHYNMKPDKILEIDTGRKHSNRGLHFYSGQLASNEETPPRSHSLTHDDDEDEEEDGALCSRTRTRMRRHVAMHTPTKSDVSATSCFSAYSDCPSYMAFTQSSKAKIRSISAPRHTSLLHQQQQECYDSRISMKRWTLNHHPGPTPDAAMHATFASKAYPGSGHLDRLGMPIRNNQTQLLYYSGYFN